MTARSITTLEFDKALVAMLDAVSAGRGAEQRYRHALLAALLEIGIEIEGVAKPETKEVDDTFTWVTRTWVDVREGDVIRPPGVEGADAKVAAIGPVVAWGVDDLQPLDAYQQRDIQFNPGKYAGTYAVRRATFHPLIDPDANLTTREMKPDAAVDIRVTRAELKAIEALGGWVNRVAIISNQE